MAIFAMLALLSNSSCRPRATVSGTSSAPPFIPSLKQQEQLKEVVMNNKDAGGSQTGKLVIVLEGRGGPEMAPGINEYQSETRIIESSGIVAHLTNKASSEEPYPIGVFRTQLESADFARLHAALEATNWSSVPTPKRGGPGTTGMSLTINSGSLQTAVTYSSMDIEVKESMRTVLEAVTQAETFAIAKPQNAIEAAVSVQEIHGRLVFRIDIKNIGVVPLYIANPVGLQGAPDVHFAGIRIAEFSDGQQPHTLDWNTLHLVSGNHPKDVAWVRLDPGQIESASTAPWQRDKSKRYLYAGRFVNYAGAEQINGLPHVRGTLYSERHLLEP
jgi:hypothetical protein